MTLQPVRRICHGTPRDSNSPSICNTVDSLDEALVLLQQGMPADLQPFIHNFINLIQQSRQDRNASHPVWLYCYYLYFGLECHELLRNFILTTFLQIGDLKTAQQIFDKLQHQDESLWNTLIASYVKHGKPHVALCLHQRMWENTSLHPSGHAFVALLKACAILKDCETGCRIHDEILELDLQNNDIFIGSSLIHMYAKCGLLEKAQDVFDNLTVRDVVSWNALLAGYADYGHSNEVLHCFNEMTRSGVSPNSVTLVCCLTGCSNVGLVGKGEEVHSEILKKGLEKELFIGNALVDTYAKFGLLRTAQHVLENLYIRDVVSWTAMIGGYAEHGYVDEMFDCLKRMQQEGVPLNAVTYVCCLKACTIRKAQEIHDEIIKRGLEKELLICNTLIDVYAKFGALEEAEIIFDGHLQQDEITWTALVSGYVEHGCGEQALNGIRIMQQKGMPWNKFTFVCGLKACSIAASAAKGCAIHVEVVHRGYEAELLVGNILIDMYAKCGMLETAEKIFKKLPVRNVVSWTTLLSGYLEHGYVENGFNLLQQMRNSDTPLNIVTYLCGLRICGNLGIESEGREMHSYILKKGLDGDVLAGCALIDMYAKFGLLIEAQDVFDRFVDKAVVAWNALIGGYIEHGHHAEALYRCRQMQEEGISPDALTLAYRLKAASGKIGTMEIHAEIVKRGCEIDSIIGNMLIDKYAKCGSLREAKQIFDELPYQDTVSWNTLIASHGEYGCEVEAYYYVKKVQETDVIPNNASFICSLKACGNVGAANTGYEVHSVNIIRGMEGDLSISNSLIDTYAKCGLLMDAQKVFDKVEIQDAVSWNALMAGYAQIGESERMLQVLMKMLEADFIPDSITFISVLNACSHAGLMEEGYIYFEAIWECGVIPVLEHYTCVIDLLCRAGQINEAIAMIRRMPFCPGIVQWHTVLSACRKWGDLAFGRCAFEHSLCLDDQNPSAYVYMSNIYADQFEFTG